MYYYLSSAFTTWLEEGSLSSYTGERVKMSIGLYICLGLVVGSVWGLLASIAISLAQISVNTRK
jgi:hypothetical protein